MVITQPVNKEDVARTYGSDRVGYHSHVVAGAEHGNRGANDGAFRHDGLNIAMNEAPVAMMPDRFGAALGKQIKQPTVDRGRHIIDHIHSGFLVGLDAKAPV
jgi:hypothetical protein